MAEKGSKEPSAAWPLVKFTFSVTIGNDELVFQEVTGLASETQVIEYRAGNNAAFSTVKMPGIKKYGNVTLKKGVFKSDKSMWAMYNAVKMNTIARKTVTICLLDESNAPAMTWKLSNAFPVKMTVTDMKSDSNEVAVETMELAYEGITIV
ncbi:MAG: phage tail protein [Chitinophagaceae bacterium]|nr:MAG: phage tail protein [Chitinophagaceae bacterium]